MGTPHDHRAAQPPIIGPETAHNQPNGYMAHSNGVSRGQCNGQGPQHNQAHNLHVFQQMQQLMKAQVPQVDKPISGQQHANGIHIAVAPQVLEQSVPATTQKNVALGARLSGAPTAPLPYTPLVNNPSAQAAQHCAYSGHRAGLQCTSHASYMHTASVGAAAEQQHLQNHQLQALAASSRPVGVACSVRPTVIAQQHIHTFAAVQQHLSPAAPQPGNMLPLQTTVLQKPPLCGVSVAEKVPKQNTTHSPHTVAPSFSGQDAHLSAPAARSEGAIQGMQQSTEGAALPARSKKVILRIKPRGERSATPDVSHAAAAVTQQSVVSDASQSAPGVAPKPAAKRRSRSKGAAPGKKHKTETVHDYLEAAQRLVKGSCARVVFLSQHQESRQQSEDDEVGETLCSLARNYNIQCHLDAVARGGVVARVSDHQTVEADRWRRKCKSVSRFEEAQAGAAQRTSGRSRKSTKPEMQRGKVAVSMCTQIQEAAAQQHRFVVRPSHTAGIGVYTKEMLPAKQILLEYQGVIVRRVHADRLEDNYEKAGKDHYLFAVDQSEFIVDATNQGGMARFVNHSCGPNCEVRTVSAEGVRRVVLVSLREIRVGEELSYDYRLNPDPDKAIRCRCRSKRCRGWL